jgi:DNA-binding beta-propeller fold protein YncE
MKSQFRLFIFAVCLFLCLAWPLRAQENAPIRFTWEEGNLDLIPPAEWDAPLPVEQSGTLRLQMAQILVDSPDVRPPGVPLITLTRFNNLTSDTDILTLLANELNNLEISAGMENVTDTTLAGFDALESTGTSGDGLLFGIGRAALISESAALIVTGRAILEQQDAFLEIFNQLVESITLPETEPEGETYGVAWQTMRTISDGDEAFLNFVGLALSEGSLYTIERDLGVIQIDAANGEILNIQSIPNVLDPADIAVDSSGIIYITDYACACIFVLEEGEVISQIEGFSEGAPSSILAAADGRLYATNVENDDIISVKAFREGALENTIRLSENLFIQPILSVDSLARVIALTQYGEIIGLAGGTATPLFTLGAMSDSLTDIAVDSNNHFVITTSDQGISILNSDGVEIARPGRIVPNSPLPGEVVSPAGVAADADGTLYFVDSDGSFGAITAMRAGLPADRVGATELQLDQSVQGTLNDQTAQQSWTYAGTAGQRITISAIDSSDLLDVALRLIAPDGSEAAYSDDSIIDQALAADGTYIVIVENISGAGAYTLGISETKNVNFDANGVARLEGELDGIFTVQRWGFEGQAGQSFTLTMQSDTLDPILRLIDANGDVIDENDDTGDPALGSAAQLLNVELPQDGRYVVEATSFEGEGGYELVIVHTG